MFFILFSDVTYSVGYKTSRIHTNVIKRKQEYKKLKNEYPEIEKGMFKSSIKYKDSYILFALNCLR